MEQTQTMYRRYDLDWLRLLAFMLLILYHAGMIFVSWGWHIQHPESSKFFEWAMMLVNQWRMPLIFFIGGAVIWYSLHKRSSGEFVKERLVRILIPLLFGMLVVVVPQAYYEQVQKGGYAQSFWDFYTSAYFFEFFTWNHLWYLVYVLFYSLVCLPLFKRWIKKGQPKWIDRLISNSSGIVLLALPIIVSEVLLRKAFPSYQNFITDLANHAFYLPVFIYGFLIATNAKAMAAIKKAKWSYLFFGVALYTVLYTFYWVPETEPATILGYAAYQALQSLNTWLWLLIVYGFGSTYLTFSNKFLKYGSQAVYPYYILHQTIIIIIGYYIIQLPIGIGWQFLLISSGTFLICSILYHFIRQFWLGRLLFGLRADVKRKGKAAVSTVAAV
ncbi:acyltransferase family protein [Pontibacter fetidus]|uniref:Acyltransferase family protein n=1 Tax=Pontibacter fetidus TaxID=2700082 RepID=A0A6B2H5Z4_9BACT|nr:acyltransferase family protein [Pontibacter fetidus]NDK55737.1 acyltransferase family protein [Pontibacter fetidus]